MNNTEYLRRNVLAMEAVGAKFSASIALKRMEAQARPPQWLLKSLSEIEERTFRVAEEMIKHRDEIKP